MESLRYFSLNCTSPSSTMFCCGSPTPVISSWAPALFYSETQGVYLWGDLHSSF
jgi:hypothetical protein